MKRKRDWSLIFVLTLCFSVLFGCGKADDAAKHSEQGQLWEEEQDGQTAGEGGENTQRSSEEETDESLSDQPLPGDGLIRYTLENQPCELADGDTVLMYGNYYQVTLSDADRKAYPALQKHIEESNADEEKELVELLEQSEADALEMMNSGWGIAFEESREFIPVRADENVFSYAMAYDSYYGGAHGFRNYQGFNLDAKTGEAISFSDVVKKTDGFSEVMYTELLAQNEELADYFGEFETDKEALFDSMAEMLADDAAGLKWALGYDGIRIYYQDYAMGSYAAGSQEEIIRFSDYPEYFTDTYVNYKENYPKIGDQVTVLEDAATVRLDSTGHVEINADDGDGEDWWYDIPIANPGWEPYVKDGIDTAAGKPSVRLTEISHETTDWLNEDVWARENGFTLPALLPYSDES
ncbi:MAG: DUF3298 domain-containing protein [Lachnospiraceae bacterium]|nr:DUF3298 domain-containing protein [Lachnospiraceae bacterium]